MLASNGRKVKQRLNYHMTETEVKIIFQYVREHCSLKYEIALLLLLTRGLRPQEMLAVNILDFKHEPYPYAKLTYREAKTNKIRLNETIIPQVADRIKAYVLLNQHQIKDGFLFPFYNKKVNGQPFMDSKVFSTWFSEIRQDIGKKHPKFLERYELETANGNKQIRYRISVYSFRRFFETYLYINNRFNIALLKEIMEYSSKFDPIKHYIRFFHEEEQKAEVLQNTFNPFTSSLMTGQTKLSAYV
jgi:hypothetical protein